ncbi:hypothetical protein [Aureivirga marina]|uniref:hypothetical protein n=1 Tax=Aureivirga marina TaxID=1182451 RepID=UPI0018CB306B|nr:hypothetical protein [Aureivirga marina]
MKKIYLLFLISFLCFSCKHKTKKELKTGEVKRYVTKDNFFRGFLFSEIKKSMSLSDFEVSKVDTDSVIFHKEIDPIETIYGQPIGNDTILYFVTYSAGSGAYKHIYPFRIETNRKVKYVSFPPISTEGYMGHDSIYFQNGKIYWKFPLFKQSDTNMKPTGKVETNVYQPVIVNDSLFFKEVLP